MKLTPAFQQWFGNSKVADAEGNPILMFHGTDKGFDEFAVKAGVKDSGWYGRGVYLTSDPTTASAYSVYESQKSIAGSTGGANVMPVHVSLQNPYLWPAGRKAAITPDETDQLTKELKKYKEKAALYLGDDDWNFWRSYCNIIPTCYRVAAEVALVMSSSASVERVFSLLNSRFTGQQQRCLKDYKEGSIRITYNEIFRDRLQYQK